MRLSCRPRLHFLLKMTDPLFFSCPVLQSETGSETLPDNPTLPALQDSIPLLFASMLISKKNKASRPCGKYKTGTSFKSAPTKLKTGKADEARAKNGQPKKKVT